jgi:Leu/Phe-tRNA-protein transferase
MTVNACWDRVVDGCRRQHGDGAGGSSWLYPPLVEALAAMHRAEGGVRADGASVRLCSVEVWRADDNAKGEPGDSAPPTRSHPGDGNQDTEDNGVSSRKRRKNRSGGADGEPAPLERKERGRPEKWRLVAGELGFAVGATYTSLTGFTDESGAGSVQLAALGRWLLSRGYQLWDLGMEMKYKIDLGAALVPRHRFVRAVRLLQADPYRNLSLEPEAGSATLVGEVSEMVGMMNCRDVIDGVVAADSAPPSRETKTSFASQAAAAVTSG